MATDNTEILHTIHICRLKTHKAQESTSLISWAHQSRFFRFPIPPHNPPLNIVGYYPVVIDNVQIWAMSMESFKRSLVLMY